MIVREAHHRQISEVLDRFDSTYGVRLKFSYYSIKDTSEDIGTADALREAATRNLIKVELVYSLAPCSKDRSYIQKIVYVHCESSRPA